MNKINKKFVVPALIGGMLIGCGGGGGSSSAPATGTPNNNGGVGGDNANSGTSTKPISVMGQIDGFGSVVVNGVHYNTDNAVIKVDGIEVDENELEVGFIVRVTGEVNEAGTEGVASLVEYFSDIRGPVESVDTASGKIVVLGQTVIVNDETFFDDEMENPRLASIAVGNVIEICGYTNADGAIIASRIEVDQETDADSVFHLSGVVSQLDTDNTTFMINQQLVNYSAVSEINTEDGALANGLHVVVVGRLVDGVFAAEEAIDLDDFNLDLDFDDTVELTGIVTDFVSPQEFAINGIPVRLAENATFEYGSIDDLRNGLLIEVTGYIEDDATFVAEEVELNQLPEVELDGIIESVDVANKQFTIHGVVFNVNEDTRFEDISEMDERQFSIEDLAAGDYVEVIASTDVNDQSKLIATRIIRDDDDLDDEFETEIVGKVINVSEPNFTLSNGIQVLVNENTEFGEEFEGEFFARAQDMLVEVEGQFEGDVLLASYVYSAALCEVDEEFSFELNDQTEVTVIISTSGLCDDDLDEFDDEEGELDEFDEEIEEEEVGEDGEAVCEDETDEFCEVDENEEEDEDDENNDETESDSLEDEQSEETESE